MGREKVVENQRCPTCGSVCTLTITGLDLVVNSGDERAATKSFQTTDLKIHIENRRLKKIEAAAKKVVEGSVNHLDALVKLNLALSENKKEKP